MLLEISESSACRLSKSGEAQAHGKPNPHDLKPEGSSPALMAWRRQALMVCGVLGVDRVGSSSSEGPCPVWRANAQARRNKASRRARAAWRHRFRSGSQGQSRARSPEPTGTIVFGFGRLPLNFSYAQQCLQVVGRYSVFHTLVADPHSY